MKCAPCSLLSVSDLQEDFTPGGDPAGRTAKNRIRAKSSGTEIVILLGRYRYEIIDQKDGLKFNYVGVVLHLLLRKETLAVAAQQISILKDCIEFDSAGRNFSPSISSYGWLLRP